MVLTRLHPLPRHAAAVAAATASLARSSAGETADFPVVSVFLSPSVAVAQFQLSRDFGPERSVHFEFPSAVF